MNYIANWVEAGLFFEYILRIISLKRMQIFCSEIHIVACLEN